MVTAVQDIADEGDQLISVEESPVAKTRDVEPSLCGVSMKWVSLAALT